MILKKEKENEKHQKMNEPLFMQSEAELSFYLA